MFSMNIIYFCIQILLPVEIQNTWERESFFDIEWANDKTEHCNMHGLDKIFTFQLCITNSISIFCETIFRRIFLGGRCCRGEGLHNSEGGLERINQT